MSVPVEPMERNDEVDKSKVLFRTLKPFVRRCSDTRLVINDNFFEPLGICMKMLFDFRGSLHLQHSSFKDRSDARACRVRRLGGVDRRHL